MTYDGARGPTNMQYFGPSNNPNASTEAALYNALASLNNSGPGFYTDLLLT